MVDFIYLCIYLYFFVLDKLLYFYRWLNRDMRFDVDISISIYIFSDVNSLWLFLNYLLLLFCDGFFEGLNVINIDLRYLFIYLNCLMEMIYVFSKY